MYHACVIRCLHTEHVGIQGEENEVLSGSPVLRILSRHDIRSKLTGSGAGLGGLHRTPSALMELKGLEGRDAHNAPWE